VISKDFDILKKKQIPGHVTKWNLPSFFGFDSETVIWDGFTRFANPVSVLLVKQALSQKSKLEPVLTNECYFACDRKHFKDVKIKFYLCQTFLRVIHKNEQELSYRQQIACQLRTQCAEGIYRHKYYTQYTVTLKYRLRVTQGHWKRNHWIDRTRLSSSRVI